MEMRRKNMLALGLSAVLCTGLFAPASYADILDNKDTYVPEVEKTAETAGTVEGLDDFPEETAVEGKTVSIEEEVPTTEAEDSEELAERKSESTEDSKEDIGGTESTVATSGYSGFRSAVVTKPLDNKIVSLQVSFEDPDFPARDHMKVHREKKVNVTGIVLRGGEVGVIYNPSPDLYKILPEREVEKKVNDQWVPYNRNYFTPGEYHYVYTLAEGKKSPYYLLPIAEQDGDGKFAYTIVSMYERYFYQKGEHTYHQENLKVTRPADAKYRYYTFESEAFTVKEAKIMTKVYLRSSFDIHNVKVGDTTKRATLQVEKVVLKDGTELLPKDLPQPFLMNFRNDFPENLDQYKLYLESYPNEAGKNGNLRFTQEEDRIFPEGRYKVLYVIQPYYTVDNYRFLVSETDDNYGKGTEIYVNNEPYEVRRVIPDYEISTITKITSPFFDAVKVEKKENYSGSTGNSGSSSKGGSSGSGSSGGSSSGSGGSGGSSGGGSGSFKVSSSLTGQVLGVDRSLSGGQWVQDEKGWWYKRADGSYPKNSWGYEAYNGKSYWYYFLDSGYMATGWVEVNGSKYYLFPNSDGWKGRMLTGWQWIDGNCYYLDSQGQNEGALYRNTTTPDGYAVDAEGRWVVNGAVQKK
ncbi:cell wall-binding repeat protein [Oribacterium sinus F0268]|uniref:Cell wall-binding repeat protein n=2 Tax=Oribacterium sinus TaxID=237576 RepID=C2KXI0_9FIRM|nr:cell wall-binding repeat protein [Oribacterium sinus F0268]